MKKILLPFLLLLTSCSIFSKNDVQPAKPLVIVSAAPYKLIVTQIAGETVDVRGIIPPDVDPHNFEPSPRDMAPISRADLWIQVGEEFEYLLQNRLKETTPNLKVIDLPAVTETLTSTCHHHHHHHHGCAVDPVDTHYWLDPITVISQAKIIANTLSTISPTNASLYKKNYKALADKLSRLNANLSGRLKPFAHNAYLTTHTAYGYFCHRYHLEQIGIEADDGKEVRSGDIHAVLQTAIAHKNELIGILIQPQHVNRAAETLGEELELPLFMVNPYEEDYIDTIESLARITEKYGKKL